MLCYNEIYHHLMHGFNDKDVYAILNHTS